MRWRWLPRSVALPEPWAYKTRRCGLHSSLRFYPLSKLLCDWLPQILAEVSSRGKTPIIVGGGNTYVQARASRL